MPRSYSTRAAALTVGVSIKWLDNVLSHHDLPGIARGRQGLERRITDDGLVAIELVRILSLDFGSPMARAVELAVVALESRQGEDAVLVTRTGLTLTVPLGDLSRRLRERLQETLETLALPARGRPRRGSSK